MREGEKQYMSVRGRKRKAIDATQQINVLIQQRKKKKQQSVVHKC